MSKPGLGKGLDELMNGDQVAGRAQSVRAAGPASREKGFGRGLTTLVSAHATNGETETAQPKRSHRLPAWFFFAADLLLLAFVVAITFDAPPPFDSGTIIFCGVSVALGCALALVGAIRK